VQSTSNSPNRPAVTEALHTRPNGGRGVDPSPLAGVGALGERDALQLKIDSGGRLSPVEQGAFDRLSALGEPEREQLYLAQQEIEAPETTTRNCTDSHPIAEGFLSLFYTEPKIVDDFTLLNASPQDISDFNDTLEYLQANDINGDWKSETAVDLLSSLPDCASIRFNNYGITALDMETGIIHWDPRGGLLLDNGYQSPALGLVHEIDHAVNFQEPVPTGDGYGNTEERRVISGSETQIAKDLGEPTRTNHDGNPYRVGSSTQNSNSD
jgi:hypothetical protein